MKSLCYTILFFLLLTLQASALSGRVVRVLDGDTVEILTSDNQNIRIRLYGIDCPEKAQPFGQKAKQFVLKMCAEKQVDVDVIDTDRYGRSVGVVKLMGTVVNSEIIKAGLAWQYEKYCKMPLCSEWKQLEVNASKQKLGLWSEPNPQSPWDFRHGNKSSGTAQTKKQARQNITVEYHGNVKSQKFHQSGCKHYDCSNCSVSFANREEAIKAGYTPCGICKP